MAFKDTFLRLRKEQGGPRVRSGGRVHGGAALALGEAASALEAAMQAP